MKLLVGADPELFLKSGNKFVGAHDYLPGTKKAPYDVAQGAVQVDGLAAEFNIVPASDVITFANNIDSVMYQLRAMLPTHIDLVIEATAHFDEKYMESVPEEQKILGCDPDFSAYSMSVNPRPDQHKTMRTAAGHIHVGWTDSIDPDDFKHFASCATITKQLDFYLGLPSVLLDNNTERRQMYGKAGAFRPKPYGAEYRVLSNFWIKDNVLRQWAFNNTNKAFNLLAVEGINLPNKYGDVCQDIINNSDKAAAEALIKELGITLP